MHVHATGNAITGRADEPGPQSAAERAFGVTRKS